MKFKFVFFLSLIMTATTVTEAQVVSNDSINTLKQEKTTLELSKQLNDRKLKLAKLENSLDKQLADMVKAREKVQKSADANAESGADLTNDPSNKKLARNARKSAKSTEHYAKQARKEAAGLETLQKDIESLKSQIRDDESKLAAMHPVSVPLPPHNR